jgi:hypothetical protein
MMDLNDGTEVEVLAFEGVNCDWLAPCALCCLHANDRKKQNRRRKKNFH